MSLQLWNSYTSQFNRSRPNDVTFLPVYFSLNCHSPMSNTETAETAVQQASVALSPLRPLEAKIRVVPSSGKSGKIKLFFACHEVVPSEGIHPGSPLILGSCFVTRLSKSRWSRHSESQTYRYCVVLQFDTIQVFSAFSQRHTQSR